MRLLIGPPGSGKTTRVLRFVEESMCGGRDGARLLVPTSTMAEHLRNELARRGLLVRRRAVQTLWQFLEAVAGDLPQLPQATYRLLVREALAAEGTAFGGIQDLPGFQSAVAERLAELAEAGVEPDRAAALLDSSTGRALSAVYARVGEAVRRRGLYWRAERLRAAAERAAREGVPGVGTVALDGFFTLTAMEVELIAALGGRHNAVVTLPEWAGTEPLREALRRRGFDEQRCAPVRRRPALAWFAAPSLIQETEEIARQILEQAAAGRPFREMGVILRSRSHYLPALQTTFERFGIPARFYFAEPLEDHPAVQRIVRLIEARLAGWDHEATLAALRMAPASAALDRFEFSVLEQAPAKGLEPLEALAGGERLRELLAALRRLDARLDGRQPASEWAGRLRSVADLFTPAWAPDSMRHEEAARWRTAAAAVAAYEAALDETADAIGRETPLELAEFWREVRMVLAGTALRSPDRRRNVVHVMDVYEARQWELPVVFLCGLLEGQSPLHHSEDPLITDAQRLRLRQAGIRLPTTEEQAAEERFLFELAVTRATERAVLSYPRYDERGDEPLRSFLVDELLEREQPEEIRCVNVRVRSALAPAPPHPPTIQASELRLRLAERHARLSASSIETFLECPFRFFAGYSLNLKAPPRAPRERLDRMLQGQIVHAVLKEWVRRPAEWPSEFERVFHEECCKARVPAGYRREAIRRELLRNLRNFERASASWPGRVQATEEEFRFELADGLEVCGKIDRIDLLPDGRALVIDYKYSSPERLREQVEAHEEGEKVQGGLYLLAARRALGLEPAGVLFCALRKQVAWQGWHTVDGVSLGTVCAPAELDELVARATDKAVETARAIASGDVEPRPVDDSVCRTCDYVDICRVETRRVAVAGGGATR